MFELCEDLPDRVEVRAAGVSPSRCAHLTRMALASLPLWLPRWSRMMTSPFVRLARLGIEGEELAIDGPSMTHGALMQP